MYQLLVALTRNSSVFTNSDLIRIYILLLPFISYSQLEFFRPPFYNTQTNNSKKLLMHFVHMLTNLSFTHLFPLLNVCLLFVYLHIYTLINIFLLIETCRPFTHFNVCKYQPKYLSQKISSFGPDTIIPQLIPQTSFL